jgi:AcrR family transcriptional regulator
MTATAPISSARREELLERAYLYVLEHGLASMSLRPLAAAVGSSPRVLLFLFGSKDGLVRALLARARADELRVLDAVRAQAGSDITAMATEVWRWLAADEHRGLLTLWTESYARSMIEPDGPWAGFAAGTVRDWLALLSEAQPAAARRSAAGEAQRTLVLAILRGGFLDLIATGDVARTTRAVQEGLRLVDGGRPSPRIGS